MSNRFFLIFITLYTHGILHIEIKRINNGQYRKKNTPYSHVLTIAKRFEIILFICLRIPHFHGYISLPMFQIFPCMEPFFCGEGCNVIIIQTKVPTLMQYKLMNFINSNTIVTIYNSIICMLGLNSGSWLEFFSAQYFTNAKVTYKYSIFTLLKEVSLIIYEICTAI